MQIDENAVRILRQYPVWIGHKVGFDRLTELHNKWLIDMIFGEEDETILAHRLSFKTTCLSIAIATLMITYPDRSIIFMRKTANDVAEVVRQVAKILVHPEFKKFAKAITGKDYWIRTATYTQVDTTLNTSTRGMTQLVGLGIESSLTGKHAYYVFTDDIVNLKDRQSRAERERTKAIYQELQNVVERDGRIFNTGTPWHKEDAIAELMPNVKKWTYEDTHLISDEKVQELKDSMLPSLFAANYELRHIASEDVIFTNAKTGGDPALVQNGIMHIDSAFFGEDYTAYTVANHHDGKLYLLGKMKRKHVEDMYDEITAVYNANMCSKGYTEDNADKGLVARDLRKHGLKMVTYHESMNKHVKIVTYGYAAWKDIVFVEGTDKEYIEQILEYTEDADHDDAPDSMACVARLLSKKRNRTEESQPYLM